MVFVRPFLLSDSALMGRSLVLILFLGSALPLAAHSRQTVKILSASEGHWTTDWPGMEVPTTLDCSPTRPRDCVQVPTGPAPPMPIRHAKVIILADLPNGNEVAMIRNANYSIRGRGSIRLK